jgi:hypothetical protein
MNARNLQDFSLIHQAVQKAKGDFQLSHDSNGFYFVALSLLFDLQDDEIDNAITDNFYQQAKGRVPGKDRGIDAIYVDSNADRPTVHLLSAKYTSLFDKSEEFISSNEIDKIESFLAALMGGDTELVKDVNAALVGKVQEIREEIQNHNPTFIVHICTNKTETFEPKERARFEQMLGRYTNFAPEYHTQSLLAMRLARKGRVQVDGRIKAINTDLFEIPGGDVRALILHVDGIELLRLLSDRDHLRNNANLQDFTEMRESNLFEYAFEDNIRLYLQQRSKVNQNIKTTALSDESHRFFYFNNGITVTCDRFAYPTNQRAPIVELENIQVVNGGQTLHALSDAYKEKPERLKSVELLCRIYETKDRSLSSRIAECTNSQSPVKTRDIRSIDLVQIKLEKEFGALGRFYERKKNQYADKPKALRMDAEKCGQVALAFYEEMPLEAKNKKSLIFGDKYDDIFSDETTAAKVLLPYNLFELVEKEKEKRAKGRSAWLRYASYHILYAMGLLAAAKKIDVQYPNVDKISKLYDRARRAVGAAREAYKKDAKRKKREYADVLFFKSRAAKRNLEKVIDAR